MNFKIKTVQVYGRKFQKNMQANKRKNLIPFRVDPLFHNGISVPYLFADRNGMWNLN